MGEANVTQKTLVYDTPKIGPKVALERQSILVNGMNMFSENQNGSCVTCIMSDRYFFL